MAVAGLEGFAVHDVATWRRVRQWGVHLSTARIRYRTDAEIAWSPDSRIVAALYIATPTGPSSHSDAVQDADGALLFLAAPKEIGLEIVELRGTNVRGPLRLLPEFAAR